METTRLDAALLDRYLTGEATPDECMTVETWLAASPEAGGVVHALQGLDGGGDQRIGQRWDYAALEELRTVIRQRALSPEMTGIGAGAGLARRGRHGERTVGTRTLRGGALVDGSLSPTDRDNPAQSEIPGGKRIANLGLHFGQFGRSGSGLRSGMLRGWAHVGGVMLAAAFVFLLGWPRTTRDSGITRTYATNTAQCAVITLEDGTRVMLAPQTTLHLAEFGPESRTITLDGEAYFEIARASGTPFVVRSGTVTTRVLGTSFVVRNYRDDAGARVSVVTGKVVVSSRAAGANEVTLAAGHVGEIIDSTITVKADDELAADTRWVQGELRFYHTPLREVLATISRWYGYQFRWTDSTLVQQTVTVALSTQSSTAALAILEQVLRVNLQVVGDTITLQPLPVRSPHGSARTRAYDVWVPNKEIGR